MNELIDSDDLDETPAQWDGERRIYGGISIV
jgi:hypothetical protein